MNWKVSPGYLLAITMAVFATAGIAAEDSPGLVRLVKWSEVPLPAGATLQNKPGDSPTLLVKHDGSKVLALPLWKLEKPGITKKCYALRGRVRHREVSGAAYFELWNEFPAEKAGEGKPKYFTRTLAESGPMSRLTGTSEWRELFIPFDATQAPQPPDALELNLNLAGSGEVEVTSLALVEFEDTKALWSAMIAGFASSATASPSARYLAPALIVVGVAVLLAWLLWRKIRHDTEARRMRAMDSLP
jgi:hypothetical protein